MALALVSVTRKFGSQLALDRVSLHVRAGDCYGFIGHNGAGKTTAMRIALGLDRPTAGRVMVDGFDAHAHPREARARLGGLVEVPGFQPLLDGQANLRLLARLQGFGARGARDEARRLFDLVGLAHAGSKPVRAYSQGMRQRLGIAQALIGDPQCVLLDEPTNGLDPQGIADVRELLKRLAGERGLTVMLSSHQLRELEGLCNRVGVLHQGRLVVEAEMAALLAEEKSRTIVETDRDGEAAELLARLGFAVERGERGGLALDLGQRKEGQIVRALVEGGFDVRRVGAEALSLERIYLRYAGGAKAAEPVATAVEPVAVAGGPLSRRAPAHPILRATRYELARLAARPGPLALLALPALFGVAAVAASKLRALDLAARVESGELASVTQVTGFQAAASALGAALPVAALVLAAIASQSLAGELARGTLRNLLLRPVLRVQVAVGKALALLAGAIVCQALLAGAIVAAAGAAFGFGDLTELLVTGEEFPLVKASELAGPLRTALASPLLALAAAAAVGFAASAAARGPAGALGLALGSLIALDVARGVARVLGFEAALPTAYVPSPLGDTSYLAYFADRAQGVSNTAFEYGEPLVASLGGFLARATAPDVVAPLAWIVASLALAAILLARRSVP
jgi:ABC-2 type transport system ATP-binding protein